MIDTDDCYPHDLEDEEALDRRRWAEAKRRVERIGYTSIGQIVAAERTVFERLKYRENWGAE